MRGSRGLVAFASAVAALALAGAANATFPGANGLLVFQSARDGDSELYRQRLDGTELRKLVDRPGTDEFNPSWSPSGTRLVFQSGPAGGKAFDLYLVNANGTGTTPLLVGPTNDLRPQFCDEDTVVFQRNDAAESGDIYAIETDGTGLRRLTAHPLNDSTPTCSPDGTNVAFSSTRDGGFSIYQVPLASAETARGLLVAAPVRLTDGVALDIDYRPDGAAIAYVAPDPADGSLEVYERSLATGTVTQRTFTTSPVQNRLPKYVPDERRPLPPRPLAGLPPTTILHTSDTDGTDAGRSVHSTDEGFEEIDPGSAAVIQPLVSRACRCDWLDPEIDDLKLTYKELSSGFVRARLTFTIDWQLACTQGSRGRCKALLDVSANRGFVVTTPARAVVTCRGRCQRASEGNSTTDGTIKVTMDAAESRPELANRTVGIDLRTTCSGRHELTRYNVSIGPGGRVTGVAKATP